MRLSQRFIAYFNNGRVIEQPEDDRGANHDENAEYNPSAYTDVEQERKKSRLLHFDLVGKNRKGQTVINRVVFEPNGDAYLMLNDERMLMANYKLRSANLIYYRNMEFNPSTGETRCLSYVIGMEDNDVTNHVMRIYAEINEYGEVIKEVRECVGVWTPDGIIKL